MHALSHFINSGNKLPTLHSCTCKPLTAIIHYAYTQPNNSRLQKVVYSMSIQTVFCSISFTWFTFISLQDIKVNAKKQTKKKAFEESKTMLFISKVSILRIWMLFVFTCLMVQDD